MMGVQQIQKAKTAAGNKLRHTVRDTVRGMLRDSARDTECDAKRLCERH